MRLGKLTTPERREERIAVGQLQLQSLPPGGWRFDRMTMQLSARS